MEQLGVVRDDLELGVVERQPAAEMLDLAGHHDLRADRQPALDEAAAEPGRLDAPGLVLEPGDRALGAPPEARLDADVADARLGRHDRAVRLPDEVAQVAHLAQVVVAPRQVEQQVADGVEVELDPGPPERRAGGQPGPGQRGRQQLDRIGRDGGPDSSPWPRLLGCDQVPVVRLAAVADLDLDAGRRRADPAGHRLGLGQVGAVAVEQGQQLEARG